MKKSNTAVKEITVLSIGELLVAALVVCGFAIASAFLEVNYLKVILGALIGAAVTVANFAFLTVSVNNAIDSYMEIRGTREMTEEEAEKFTAEHSMEIQNKVKTSFIVRTVSMLAVLIIAFVTGWVNPLATVIPLLAYRPVLMLGEKIRKKQDPVPNPDNFIRYGDEEDAVGEESDE
ncbi:MAG: ATP synthase subunit I [Clostridia bacterium]|nr:ATP synthase subunit I [Clostridia bacterium]